MSSQPNPKAERRAARLARKAEQAAARAEARRLLAQQGQTPIGVVVTRLGDVLKKLLPGFK
jgi:4'-phosphopantetheinyl transferase EntD